MSKQVAFDVDGQEITFEVTESIDNAEIFAAGAEDVIARAQKPFELAVKSLKAISSKFVELFSLEQIKEAEICLGLKATAKGDFIVVGSSGEASLNLKLKIQRA
jgi:hypothetical protein